MLYCMIPGTGTGTAQNASKLIIKTINGNKREELFWLNFGGFWFCYVRTYDTSTLESNSTIVR